VATGQAALEEVAIGVAVVVQKDMLVVAVADHLT
jgi:hypothetical protein